MTGQIVPRRASPPWRPLGMLAVLVLLAHALVLQTQPARVGPAPQPPSGLVAPLITRSISLPPPAAASPPPVTPARPAPAPAKAAAKPARKPVLKEKVPVAQAAPTHPAMDSIANLRPEPGSADPAPAGPDSAPPWPSAAETAPATPADSATAPPATPAASAADAPPPAQTAVGVLALAPSAQLDYQMTGSAKGLSYSAKGQLAWQNSGDSYSARMTVKALFLGSRTLSSTGRIGAEGLAPSRFSDKSRSEVAAHFEPDQGRISFSANTPDAAWTPGTQDRVSVLLQLGGMLAGNPAGFPVGSTLSMLTVGPRDADHWTFVVESEEPLSLPFGDLATVKLSRQPRREYDQKVEVWYAPALAYLPVRSKITQANGDFVDQQLRELTRP